MCKKRYKSAIGCVARLEEAYIQEWIVHHYLIGFDKILVVLHKIDGEIDNTFNKIMNLPQFVLDKVVILPYVNNNPGWDFQEKAYNLIYDLVSKEVEWLAIWDVDELFYDFKQRKINDIIDTFALDTSQILFWWKIYGSNNNVRTIKLPNTRLSALTKRMPLINSYMLKPAQFKSIIKVDRLVKNDRWCFIHFCKTIDGCTRDANGLLISDKPLQDWKNIEQLHYNKTSFISLSQSSNIAHYITGSLEDWVMRHSRCKNRFNGIEHNVDYFKGLDNQSKEDDYSMLVYHNAVRAILEKVKI